MRRRLSTQTILPAVLLTAIAMWLLAILLGAALAEAGATAAQLARVRTVMVWGGGAVVLLAGLLAATLGYGYESRIRRLTAAVEAQVEGAPNLPRLLPTQDEFGVLVRTFNSLTERLRRSLRAAEEERVRLSAVLSNMADGVMIFDPDGGLQTLNAAARRLLGLPDRDLIGLSFAEIVRHHDLIDLWHQCLESGEEQTGAAEIGQGDMFLQIIITPQPMAEVQGYVVVLQDLTQIQRLRTVRRDFVSNISHELRTPLASLKAVVETLRDSALEDPPAARRFLDRADAEVDAMTQMVEELLELSRIESGQVPLQMVPTTAAALVERPLDRMQMQIAREGLTVELDIADDLPLVWADGERVQRVVTNLVHNATKFTPEGGVIGVRAYRYAAELKHMAPLIEPGPQLVIEVRDNGVGIPAQDLQRIFERFFKADRARTVSGGTGLGLAIARHIVENHGGTIWARSWVGRGSRFFFTLPIVEEDLP